MSKEAIDHVKKVAEQVNEGGKSLADLMSKTCLGLEETLRYRFPISSELKAYYEGIEKGIDIPALITKIKNDNNLGSGTLPNLNGSLTEQLNYYNNQITQKQNTLLTAQQAYDNYNYPGSGNNQSTTLVNAITQAQNSLNSSVSLRDKVKTEIENIKAIIAPLQDFNTNGNLVGIAASRKLEITEIKNNISKFSLNNTSIPHNIIDQNNATTNSAALGSHIFSSAGGVGQSYLFYDEQSQKETKSNKKDGSVSTSVLLKDGSYREVKIKGLYIDTTTQKVVFDKIQVEGVDDAEYPIQIRSLNVRGTLQEGGREYYMDKQLSLTINQGVGTVNKSAILTNPAFTAELASRMTISYATDIQAVDKKDSVIYKTIHSHLEKYPDYVALSEYQKDELYKNILGITQVNTVDAAGRVSVEDLFGGVSVAQAISTTQSWDRTTNTQSDHPSAFASYVQGKDVEPKAFPEDMSSEVKYRNRLSRNLTVLTKNYLTHRLNSYLNDNYVTQAVNEQITRYTTNYQHQQLNNTTNTAQNAQAAATTLRNQRPKGAEKDGINKRTGKNDSRLRLVAGKSATISDTIKSEDGTEQSYTATLNTSDTKGNMSVALQLPDGSILKLAGPTPGDLLSKILTSARIDESQGGQRMRQMMAFGTLKALTKLARDAGAPLENIPINGTRDEYRIRLTDDDTLSFARYNYESSTDEFKKGTPAFDEKNPDHKLMMTHTFITQLNSTLNIILDKHYDQFKNTMSDSTNVLKRAWRFMTFDRERMSYEADSNIFGIRSLRGWMTKAMNRKEQPVEGFSFPIQSGNKNGTVSYDPKGMITVEIDGKIRKGKNLAKLVNPWAMRNFFGVFGKKQNMTDGFEMQIMSGFYSQLSGQLMQNTRVNKYTYLVRDKQNGVMYACYAGDDGTPRMGIIEHTNQNDMLMMDRQKGGRHVGLPEQGVRELNEQETQSVLSRPDIMDTVLQNMLKSREEIVRIPLTGYRSMGLTANVASQLAIAGAVGGIDMLAGGRLSSHAGPAAYTVGNYTTGTIVPKINNIITTTGENIGHAINGGYGVARKAGRGLYDGAVAAAA